MSPFSATFPNILMVMEIIINSKTSVQSPLGDEVRKEHDEMMQGTFQHIPFFSRVSFFKKQIFRRFLFLSSAYKFFQLLW